MNTGAPNKFHQDQILVTVEVKRLVGRHDEKVKRKCRHELVFFFQSFNDFLFEKKQIGLSKELSENL